MKTFFLAMALGFVLSPNALLRKNAAWLAENAPSKAALSAKLLLLDAAGFPDNSLNARGTLLDARWTIELRTQTCALSLSSPEGTWDFVWKKGLVSATHERWPAVEALLSGACGVLMANASSEKEKAALEAFLSSQRVNVKVSKLGLLGREVVYIIGEAQARSSQYWIGKDDYAARGLRWLDASDVLWEVHFKKGDRFPYAIELQKEGQMALKLQTKGLRQ